MNEINLNELYFKWLCSMAFPDELVRNKYFNVLNLLYNTPFEYILSLDENRKRDGIDLRYHFSYACKIPFDIVSNTFDKENCSMLEMMIALSRRCDEDIMFDFKYGDRTHQWFAIMFRNLGLDQCDDSVWDINLYYQIKDVLHRCMYREYNNNGSNGGLFISPYSNYDFRNMQLWDQMCLCMNEIIYSS